MTELVGDFFGAIFNRIGAMVRWSFSKIKRSNGTDLTFREYLYGPDPQGAFTDEDETNNALIGGIVFFALLLSLLVIFVF